jgi:hypothetical protein
MSEQGPQGQGQRRVEIGLDGKPFEVWEPAPQPTRPAERAPSSADWVGGSYYPRGPAETAMLETPRQSMEFNHYAWYSLFLGGLPLIAAIVSLSLPGGGIEWTAALIMSAIGAYYGLRSHNAGVRGFCTNGRLGLAGFVLSLVGALATVAAIMRLFSALPTM